jgi:glycosyltransferase involved in cell wall biosynthesis
MSKKGTLGFLTYDWSFGTKPLQPNGCAWYRCFLPMKELSKLDWETGMGIPGYNQEHGFGILIPDEKAIHGWDIVVLKLIMLNRVVDQVTEARKKGQKIVVDIDDHMEALEPTNMAFKTTSPDANPNNNRDHYNKIIAQADALIMSTPFLKEYYQKKYPDKPIFVVRNSIDIDRWHMRKDKSGNFPTVGWVGATPWRSGDLETLNPFFGEYLSKNNLRFHHSGSIINAPSVLQQIGIEEKSYTSEPMKPIMKYPELFRKMDIGIVPLRDVEFNHAKSFIKGMEYAAAGIPWIAGWSPEYEYITSHGIGRLARTPDDWLSHLDELKNPKVRNIERQKNRQLLKELHSTEVRAKEWDQVFEEILAL